MPGANVTIIAEDLSTLSPKKLGKRLEQLTADALPCLGIAAYEASPGDGLTTALSVDSRGRRDVHDLVRVVQSEPGGFATVSWSRCGGRRSRAVVLLLHVAMERPVRCTFDVRFDIGDHASDAIRAGLPLLLAAERFALSFDRTPDRPDGLVWIGAPAIREPLVQALAA
jgi:hypothetical protein